MSMWSALNITPTLMHFHTLFTTTQCAEIHALTRRDVRCVVLILNRSVSLVSRRSSKEAGGFSHVEPSWQEETREEVHGGPQCHRRRLACTGQEGHRHDTAWAKVRMEVKRKTQIYKINTIFKWTNRDRHSSVCAFVYLWRISQPSGVSAGLDSESGSGVSRLECGQT